MFQLHYGNAIDDLAQDLAARLAAPRELDAMLQPELVLVPNAGLQRWLQMRLTEHNGVLANVAFLRPAEWVWRLLRAAAPMLGVADLPADSPWEAERLGWRLLRDFDQQADLPPLLLAYLDPDDPVRALQLAQALATVFDKYQAWRRDWVMRWTTSGPDDAHDWQGQLFARMAKAIETPSRAALIDAWLRHYGSGAQTPPGLPSRLHAFACLNVSPDVLRMLGISAQQADLHFYLPTPCAEYWGDLQSPRERLRNGQWLDADDENPLLASMGRAGRELIAQLFSYDEVQPEQEHEYWLQPDPRTSLLARLQADVLARRAPTASDHAAPGPADPELADDCSLRVHACHSRLREIEVLHDQLLALLQPAADGSVKLRPRDIAVLAPNIDDYADAIHAVFGGLPGNDPRYIAYSLGDTGQRAENPYATSFLQLFELAQSGQPLSETLDLLQQPGMLQRYRLQAEQVDRIGQRLHAAGVRQRRDVDTEAAFSWGFGQDRLLLGMALGEVGSMADVAALPGLQGGESAALDAVLELNALIDRNAAQLRQAKTASQWQQALHQLIDDLLPIASGDDAAEHAISVLHRHIADWADAVNSVDADWRLPRETVQAALRQRLDVDRPRQGLLGGGVSFAGMVPLRCVPFKVIWVLGMDDGAYPRREPGGDISRLLAELRDPTRRRIGDRSVRDDDRFLFLQLLCAAGAHFHLSYVGFDATSGSALPPAAPVLELLDTASACFADAAAARKTLLREHPLQPFDPRLFAIDANEPSFRHEWLDAARASRNPPQPAPAFCAEALPPLPNIHAGIDLDLTDLQAWSRLPVRSFLRERLGIRIPHIDATDIDALPLDLDDHLADSQRRQALCRHWDTAAQADFASSLQQLRAEAELPVAAAGERAMQSLWQQCLPLWQGFAAWRQARAARTAELPAFNCAGYRLQGQIAWLGSCGGHPQAAVLRVGKIDGRHLLAAWLQHLACACAGIGGDTLLFGQDATGFALRRFAALTQTQAQQHLQDVLQLYRQSHDQALPLLPRAAANFVEACRKGKEPDVTFAASFQVQRKEDRYELDDASVKLAFRPQHIAELAFDDPLARQARELAMRVFTPVFDALDAATQRSTSSGAAA